VEKGGKSPKEGEYGLRRTSGKEKHEGEGRLDRGLRHGSGMIHKKRRSLEGGEKHDSRYCFSISFCAESSVPWCKDLTDGERSSWDGERLWGIMGGEESAEDWRLKKKGAYKGELDGPLVKLRY